MLKPIIIVKKLSKTYQNDGLTQTVLDDLNLIVNQGEFVAVMGPSGSGKSTLMHILGLLDKPTSGQYFLDGQNVANISDDEQAQIRNHKIGFVFQAYNLLPRTSALDNVRLPMEYAEIDESRQSEKALQMLKLVDLTEKSAYPPNKLSGGQQQRVAIARALVMNPALLLADEPTGNIASAQADEVMKIFQRLNQQGHTIVMITHEPDIASWASRIVRLFDGKIKP